MAAIARLRIRLLGELQLLGRGGRPMALPASKKTRALVGYLVATGHSHRRERLCDLLWEGPDDPRAELRWSLNKIRPLLNEPGITRLTADRERVGFEAGNADVDLVRVRHLLAAGVSALSADELKAAVDLFRGEFLDGLDLPACYRYQEWCLAEREAVSRLRLAALDALVRRLDDMPDEALVYARALVAVDPLSEIAHATVVRFLGRLGRRKEALEHCDYARRLLEKELGAALSGKIERERRALGSPAARLSAPEPVSRSPVEPAVPARSGDQSFPFVGRNAECARLESLASAAAAGEGRQVLLIRGEAGIGKSRLLARLRERMHAVGGRAIGGRAFEAEMGRPYAIWIDLLRALVHERGPEGLSDLAPLLPEIARRRASPADKSQLFDAVVNVLKIVIAEQPTAMTLDDLQWIDEASASLLHYVIRTFDGPSRLLLACAARSGELEDNAAAAAVLRALQREGRSVELALGPVSPEEAAELVHAVNPSLDSDRVFADSEGNPLFILELARARSHQARSTRDGDADADRSPSIEAVIAGQLARLKDRSRELLTWAAALGRSFSLDPLVRIAAFDTFELLPALEELERRGIVKPVGPDTYDFVHDLVRQTAYASISHPRRKLLHRRIAQFLAAIMAGDDGVANDLVRHAALCEDYEVAARACVVAGERSLRMFANAEAIVIAERGLRYVARLGHGATRLEVHVGLLKICILAAAGPGMRPPPPLRDELVTAVAEAEKLGLAAVAATGHYLLSVLNQQAGDSRQAQEDTLRAAQAGRATEPIRQAQQLANTARCLLELEAEVDRARTLLHEAELIAGPLGLQLCELHWGQGLLRRWDGEDEAAVKSIERALALARAAQDRWREYKCLTWLAVIELERGRCSAAIARCADLLQVALNLGESEVPFVMTLEALARLTAGEYGAADAIAAAIRKLRAVDDKSYLAYALNTAARLHLGAGRIDTARACAAEALALAETVQRRNEMVIAQATLARLGHPDDGRQMAASIKALMHEVAGQDRFSSLARSAVLETMEAADSNAGSNAMH